VEFVKFRDVLNILAILVGNVKINMYKMMGYVLLRIVKIGLMINAWFVKMDI
jgi:hypothetical protein